MREVKPKVRLIGYTAVDFRELRGFLDDEKALQYAFDSHGASGMEELIKVAGKACYKSYHEGLNKNVSKTRNDTKEYLANILKVGHGSVLEHASMTFAMTNVSRVLTHELVRHRVGTAFSQESLRYVRGDDLGFWMPEELSGLAAAKADDLVSTIEKAYKDLEQLTGIDSDEKMSFTQKKKITSALRRILPQGMSTTMIFTANVRTLRHLILLRTSPHAEAEIREVFDQVATICMERVPHLFQDFSRTDDGTWSCANPQQPYETR